MPAAPAARRRNLQGWRILHDGSPRRQANGNMTERASQIDKMMERISGETARFRKQDMAVRIVGGGDAVVRRECEGGSIDFRG